jgi:predicted RNA methylase
MLAIGAAILGATHVLAVDCDEGALEVAAENCEAFDNLPVSTIMHVQLRVADHC